MQELNETDKAILRHLQKDAKITTKELSSILNLSISPIYDRIKRLESLGYIKQYVAVLDKGLLGQEITAFCQVSMRYHNEAFIEKFEQEIKKLKEVQECYHMAGQVDFLLKINIGNLNEYHDFVRYKLSKIGNIGVLNSTFVLKDIKHTHAFNV
jgi:DNA-binding Lrp family transcriptional regulator